MDLVLLVDGSKSVRPQNFELVKRFVNQIVEYIVHNGLMKDLSVLQGAPFTDNGSIVEVFADMTVWFDIKRVIDEINANAIAA